MQTHTNKLYRIFDLELEPIYIPKIFKMIQNVK